jgi:hypothetical protein
VLIQSRRVFQRHTKFSPLWIPNLDHAVVLKSKSSSLFYPCSFKTVTLRPFIYVTHMVRKSVSDFIHLFLSLFSFSQYNLMQKKFCIIFISINYVFFSSRFNRITTVWPFQCVRWFAYIHRLNYLMFDFIDAVRLSK